MEEGAGLTHMLHICCHCTTVSDFCPSNSTSCSTALNQSDLMCQGFSIECDPARAGVNGRRVHAGGRALPILCSLMRSSLWLALTACMALRPLGCDALFASLLLMATGVCGSGASSFLLPSRAHTSRAALEGTRSL